MKPRDILMEIFITVIIASGLISVMSLFVHLCNKDIQQTIEPSTHVQRMYETASYSESTERDVIINDKSGGKSVTYTALEVPYIDSSFKTWMSYRAVTDNQSPQYKFIHTYGWCDHEGFMRCTGEKDLGIQDDYYLIALGSYYGTTIGTKYRITLDTGRVFYGVLADFKADIHTNSTNQHGTNNDIIEFLVDTKRLNKSVKYHGTANVYMPLNGSVAKIERIDFIME